MLCERGKHNYKTTTVWEPIKLEDQFYVQHKIRIQECKYCGLKRTATLPERIRYGASKMPQSLGSAKEGEMLELTRSLLLDVFKSKTHKRWEAWKSKWLLEYDYQLFNEAVDSLFSWGLLVKQEKKLQNRIQTWEPTYVFANLESFHLDIARLLHVEPYSNNDEMELLLINCKKLKPISTQTQQIKSVMYEQLNRNKSHPRSLRMIQILSALYDLTEKKKTMSWKMFSQRYFKSTKALQENDKQRLQKLLGKKLSEFGIFSNKTRIWFSGDFAWELNGYINYGLGFLGSLSLPRNMTNKMNIVYWNSPYLLIIENKDLFDTLIDSQWLNTQKWAVLYGKGFVSSEEIELISRASIHNLKTITIWPDFDPFGLSIAMNLKKKLTEKDVNIPVHLFGFSQDWGEHLPVKSNLSHEDLEEIQRLMNSPLPSPCLQALQWMKNTKQKAEQELYFDLLDEFNVDTLLSQEIIQLL